MTTKTENPPAPAFSDKRNITSGMGRVIWAPAAGPFRPEGWVLPGGLRTTDEDKAWFAAHAIHQLSIGRQP